MPNATVAESHTNLLRAPIHEPAGEPSDHAFARRVGVKYGGVDLRGMGAGLPARVVVTVEPTRVGAVDLGAG